MRPSAGLALSILLLTGCSGPSKKEPQVVVPVSPEPKFASQNLEELLRFGSELARLPAEDRLAECEKMLELRRSDRSLGLQLHVFTAQILAESCGDVRETSSVLKARQSEIQDERVRQFVTFQEQVLNRLETEIEQKKSLDLNLKFTQEQARKKRRELITFESEAKNCESDLVSCESNLARRESEVKALQEKLDALKSIEQNLGGSQGH